MKLATKKYFRFFLNLELRGGKLVCSSNYFELLSLRRDCPSIWKFKDDEVAVVLFSDFFDLVDVRDALDELLANVRSDTKNKLIQN